MIVAYHVIIGAYGFWLPNDPRGSWSDFVGSYELAIFGKAIKTSTRSSVASQPHDVELRQQIKNALLYRPVKFTGLQARAIGRGFAKYLRKSGFEIWACAILPDHIHLIIGRGRLSAEQIAVQLKGHATRQLEEERIHPLAACRRPTGTVPKCFARGEWKVFLGPEDIERANRYVEENPLKAGLPTQRWNFDTAFCN